MEKPCSILKPDWSLAAHYFQQIYEEREDVDSFVDSLYAGSVDLTKDEKYNALMDTFDTLMKYNIWGDAPIAVEDDQVHQVMAEAQVAFQFGGCWEWNDIVDYDYEAGSIGMMPVPQNMQDAYTGCLVGGGSKYFYIDNSENTTDEQREAGLDISDFLLMQETKQMILQRMIERNPALQKLIDALGLEVMDSSQCDEIPTKVESEPQLNRLTIIQTEGKSAEDLSSTQEQRWHGRNAECHKCKLSHEGINGTYCGKLHRYVEYGKGNCGIDAEVSPAPE
jgi:raffinose/stachyose/melibiose transport system substrate-binding protein